MEYLSYYGSIFYPSNLGRFSSLFLGLFDREDYNFPHSQSFAWTGRNTFGTTSCFGEKGLKIWPDVFRNDNCEQKKHFLLCKMSPASHFFLFEKGEKNCMKLFTVVVTKHFGKLSVPLLVPDAFSRTRTVQLS